MEIVNNLRKERTDAVCQRRMKSGMKFFRGARAANDTAAIEHQSLETGPGQISGGDETVVSRADDDYIVLIHAHGISRGLTQIYADRKN
jgi:hypothetical protein